VITLLANKNCHDPTPKNALDNFEARSIKGNSLERLCLGFADKEKCRNNILAVFSKGVVAFGAA